jgi:hypothetical protein
VLPVETFVSDAASGAGYLAATIAIGGFLGQVWPALRRKDERAVRAAAVIGGLFGLGAAALTLAGSSMW